MRSLCLFMERMKLALADTSVNYYDTFFVACLDVLF